MGEALFVLVVIVLLAVPVGLTVLAFVATRALVVGEGSRTVAGVGLAAILLLGATGLAVVFTGPVSLDANCSSTYGGGRNLETANILDSTGLWPPGLRCRYEFADGGVETYHPGFGGMWVATAMTTVFGAAMGVLVVGRQFSKKGDMLF